MSLAKSSSSPLELDSDIWESEQARLEFNLSLAHLVVARCK